MKVFKIDAGVQQVDLSVQAPYTRWHHFSTFFERDAGVEHYKLLAYLSGQCDDGEVIYDIGTFLGYSALAMAHNSRVKVVTYDLVNHIDVKQLTARDVSNIEFKLADCTKSAEAAQIAKSPLVFLDVDPHDGIQEPQIFESLEKSGFKGLLVLDDIHLNEGMKSFWNWIPSKYNKYDISKYGHHSGTGIVVFDPTRFDVVIN